MKSLMFARKFAVPRWQKDLPHLRQRQDCSYQFGIGDESSRPTTVQVMSEVGIDISDQTSKPLSDFNSQNYDAVISLCGCGVNLPEDWVLREVFRIGNSTTQGQPIETFRRVREEIKRVASLLSKLDTSTREK